MKNIFNSLSTSDIIQLFGIIASFITGIVAIVISVITLRQNSKMIEESSRPFLSIYGELINTGFPTFYIVIKNFGASPAYIKKFEYDYDFSSMYLSAYGDEDFLKSLQSSVIAPNQARICALDYLKLDKPVTFKLSYSSGVKTYHDEMTIDLKAGATMLMSKTSTSGKELHTISYTLQEMLQKNL